MFVFLFVGLVWFGLAWMFVCLFVCLFVGWLVCLLVWLVMFVLGCCAHCLITIDYRLLNLFSLHFCFVHLLAEVGLQKSEREPLDIPYR